MIDSSNINDLVGAEVYGTDDSKIGTVGQVYVDSSDQSPKWVTVKTGLFGTSESFVPLEGATYDGGDLRVAFDKSFVKDAPRIEDDGALSEKDENALYDYYGLGQSTSTQTGGLFDQDAPVGGPELDVDRSLQGHDTSGPTTDDAMTRSEEQLHVGTESVETGRARLRKHIVTENVTRTIPVSHEEVTVTREPITDANVGDALDGPELSEEEHEVVLKGERVVTEKETVPVERVSLGTETVTEQQRVSEDVSHEEIDVIAPDSITTGTTVDDDRSTR